MKKYEFDKNGECLNPDIISSELQQEDGSRVVTWEIEVAETPNGWVAGMKWRNKGEFDVWRYPCSQKNDKYPSRRKAVIVAARKLLKIKYLPDHEGLKKLIFKEKQLNLFDD